MTGGRCQATYTRQHWRLRHDEEPAHGELFDTDGRWECPRAAVEDADHCPFHLSAEERDRHTITDEDLAQRLVAELQGDRSPEAGGQAGELVGVDLGPLVLSSETVPGIDGSGDQLACDQIDTLYLVGASLERFALTGVTLGSDLALDGVEVSAPSGSDTTGEVAVRDATLGEFSLTATCVERGVQLAGDDTDLDGVRVGPGTHTKRPVSVQDDATVDGEIAVEGATVGVSSVVVNRGASVGTGDRGIAVTGLDNPETEIKVEGGGTTVASIEFDGAHLKNVFVQAGAEVADSVDLRDTTVTSNLKLDAADGSPALSVGADSDVSTCVVEDTYCRGVSVEAGASVTAVKLGGQDTQIGEVQLSGGDTTVERLLVRDEATVDRGVSVHEGATLERELRVTGATVKESGGGDHPEAVVVTGHGTSVSAVCVEGASLQGLCVYDTTVDRVELEDATVVPPPSQSGTDRPTDSTGCPPAVLVTEATVESSVAIDGGKIDGTLIFDRASLGAVDVEGELSLGGTLTVLNGTTVKRSISVDGTLNVLDETKLEQSVSIDGTLDGERSGGVVVEGGRVLGDLVVTGAIERTDEQAGLRVVENSVVGGTLRVDGASVDGVALVDATVRRRVTVVGDAEVDGELALRRDATVEGDLVVGSVTGEDGVAQETAPDGGDLTQAATDTTNDDSDSETTVRQGIELGNREDAHPTSGGVSVDGSVAVTGTASVPAGLRLSDVVVGEDLRVVGRTRQADLGAVDLFDCIVTGKVRVTGAVVDALSLLECRVGESVWVGAVDTSRRTAIEATDSVAPTRDGRPDQNGDDAGGSSPEPDTEIEGTLSIDSTPVTEDVVLDRASVGRVRVADATVDGGVRLATVEIDGPVTVTDSDVGARATVEAGAIGGLSVRESVVGRDLRVGTGRDGAGEETDGDAGQTPALTVDGTCSVRDTTVEGAVSVDCRVTGERDPRLAVESTDIEGSVSMRPRPAEPGRVSLRGSALPAGELVVPSPGGAGRRTWYDLRRATLGDLSVAVEGEGRALEHLLVLETRFDGFRFSELDDGVDASGGRLHTLWGSECTSRVDGVASPAERIGPDRPLRYVLGELYGSPRWAGTGYDADDPPPETLERTYLNAKNGASQVGDEDIAGAFFKQEKRYRRRRYWERLVCVADDDRGWMDTFGRWVGNGVFDRMAVYGESPGRVVAVSAVIIALFAGLFAVLLDRPPYGEQYLESGLLPDSVVPLLQPLTLSIESFVTLVLVGPADQRLTPLVHLLGQVEGFFGVFLVALFVFTLTRSVHR